MRGVAYCQALLGAQGRLGRQATVLAAPTGASRSKLHVVARLLLLSLPARSSTHTRAP